MALADGPAVGWWVIVIVIVNVLNVVGVANATNIGKSLDSTGYRHSLVRGSSYENFGKHDIPKLRQGDQN